MHAHGCHVRSWPSAFCHRFESMDVNDVIRVIHVPSESWASVVRLLVLLDNSFERRLSHRTVCTQMAHFVACPARTLVSVHNCLLALVGWMFSATVGAASARPRISVDSVNTISQISFTFSSRFAETSFASTFSTSAMMTINGSDEPFIIILVNEALLVVIGVALLRRAAFVHMMNWRKTFVPHQQLGAGVNNKVSELLLTLAMVRYTNCQVVA